MYIKTLKKKIKEATGPLPATVKKMLFKFENISKEQIYHYQKHKKEETVHEDNKCLETHLRWTDYYYYYEVIYVDCGNNSKEKDSRRNACSHQHVAMSFVGPRILKTG